MTEDEDTETKRKVDGKFQKEKDAIFKETIDQAQREAETQSQYSFNQDEVDYDYDDEEPEDEDVVMSDEDETMAVDDAEDEAADDDDQISPEEREQKEQEEEKIRQLPNCDTDEVAAEIFDNGIVVSIVILFNHYYQNSVTKNPKRASC